MNNTISNKKYFGVATEDFVVVSDDTQYKLGVLRDKDKEVKIDKYFNDSYDAFVKRLNEFKNSEYIPTASEEKEFRFMFEALIDSKKFLHGTLRESKRSS